MGERAALLTFHEEYWCKYITMSFCWKKTNLFKHIIAETAKQW